MIVVGTPATGDTLQAQKPIRPPREIHGKGFKDVFNEACKRLENQANSNMTKGGMKDGITSISNWQERIRENILP